MSGTNSMTGTYITGAGTSIITRNEFYWILTFRPERYLPGTNIMRQGPLHSPMQRTHI